MNDKTQERDGRPSLVDNYSPVAIRSVGRYALQPEWSDGHRTGLFTFRELRAGAGAIDV